MKEGAGKMGASGSKVSLKKNLENRTPRESGRRNNKEERKMS